MKRTTLTVDAIIESEGKIVLVRRGSEPFKDFWAIPGGHVDYMETVEHAAMREALEETGLEIKLTGLVGVYSDPSRNPDNEHRVAVAFSAQKIGGSLRGGDDAADAKLFSIVEISGMKLAFDHGKILADYLKQRSGK